MSQQLEAQIWEALRSVTFPGMRRDVVSFGFVKTVDVSGRGVQVALRVPTHNQGAGDQIKAEVEKALQPLTHQLSVTLEVVAPQRPEQAQQQAISRDGALLPGVAHTIAVASGKGGVGKSTVAANLAVSLSHLGHRVGLLDADIYGPSMPLMFGITERPRIIDDRLVPFDKHGVRVMSLGFVLDVDTPVIWRGPMVVKAIDQMLRDVAWGDLDVLIIDLPPGTGDAQLTLTQKVPLSGAIIVSTPQDVALIDARKGLAMFRKVSVPVLGLIENMSSFVCPHCGEVTDIFKKDGARLAAETLGCPFLGKIPLDPQIVLGGDAGTPIVASQPQGAHADAFAKIAREVFEQVRLGDAQRPALTID